MYRKLCIQKKSDLNAYLTNIDEINFDLNVRYLLKPIVNWIFFTLAISLNWFGENQIFVSVYNIFLKRIETTVFILSYLMTELQMGPQLIKRRSPTIVWMIKNYAKEVHETFLMACDD